MELKIAVPGLKFAEIIKSRFPNCLAIFLVCHGILNVLTPKVEQI